MAKKKLIKPMPLDWRDYEDDTGHLNDGEHGAYLMLIKQLWCTRAPIPDDDRILCRIARCDSLRTWKHRRQVLAPFFIIEDGYWHHKRVNREVTRKEAISLKRKNSANDLWAKRRKTKQVPDANASRLHTNGDAKFSGHGIENLLERGCKILGVSLTADTSRLSWPGEIGRLLDEGCDPERHIIEAFKIAKDKGVPKIAYVAQCAISLRDRVRQPRKLAPVASAVHAATREEIVRRHVQTFRDRGFWPSNEGLPPDDPNCSVDRAILAEYGFRPRAEVVPLRPQK